MKDYCTYMDRLTLSPIAHLELMEALEHPPARPLRRRLLSLGALAALFALVCAGAWGLWLGNTAGTALLPGESTLPALAAVSPTPAPSWDPQADTLTVPPLPEGYAFTQEALALPDLTGTPCMVTCTGIPTPDTTQYVMTAEQILSVFGTEDPTDLAISYGWEGFTLTGGYILRADGTLWRAWIQGERGEDSFSLVLAPGQDPPMNEHYEGYATWTENGVEVSGYSLTPQEADGSAGYLARVFFRTSQLGVFFEGRNAPGHLDPAQTMVKGIVRRGTDPLHGFTLEPLQRQLPKSLGTAVLEESPSPVPRVHPAR